MVKNAKKYEEGGNRIVNLAKVQSLLPNNQTIENT